MQVPDALIVNIMTYTEQDTVFRSWGGDNQLFCQTRKGNKVVQKRLSSQAVYKTVQRRAKAALVKEITSHVYQ